MSRYLGIGRNICQRIRLALQSHSDAMDVLQCLPGTTGLNQFIDAAQRQGIGQRLTEDARAAVAQYAALIGAAGGSQRRLIAALASRADSRRDADADAHAERYQFEARQALFEAARRVTGVECQARIETMFVRIHPNDPDQLEMIEASGIIGASWREHSTPIVRITGSETSEGTVQTPRTEIPAPIPVFGISPGSLLDGFASDPLPAIVSRSRRGELVQVFNPEGPSENPIDIVVGTAISPACGHPKREDPPILCAGTVIGTPCRWLLMDIYLEKALARACLPSMHVVRMGFTGPLGNRYPQDRWYDLIEPAPPLEINGADLNRRPTPAYARATELASALADRAGWPPDRFVNIRCVVPYPIWEMQYVMCLDFDDTDTLR